MKTQQEGGARKRARGGVGKKVVGGKRKGAKEKKLGLGKVSRRIVFF